MTWTPERRARQRELIKTWQPWRKTSGPKTAAGKAKSARNSLKHGTRSAAATAEFTQLRQLLRQCQSATAAIHSLGCHGPRTGATQANVELGASTRPRK